MATISDVAEAAGVSASTVSYVLSGKRPISLATRARVEKAIRELGFRPHAGARALASARSNVLGLVAPLRVDVNVPVIMEFVTGVVTRARTFDLDVLLLTKDDAGGIQRVSSGSMVDALIMMDIEQDDPRIPMLKGIRQPSVLIGLPASPRGLSCVDLDFEAAGSLAVRRLIDLGHTHFGLIGPTPTVIGRHTSYAERLLSGYRDASEQAAMDPVIELSEASRDGGVAAVDRLLGRIKKPTALVVHNESALPGVLSRLADHGKRIPEDISVLAIGPAMVALSQSVPLTSIDIPATAIGGIAVDLAVNRILDSSPPEIRLITPEITERASTRPVT